MSRIDPLAIGQRKKEEARAADSKLETARVSLDTTEKCSVCGQQMQPVLVKGSLGDIPGFCCTKHRVHLPKLFAEGDDVETEDEVWDDQKQPQLSQLNPLLRKATASEFVPEDKPHNENVANLSDLD